MVCSFKEGSDSLTGLGLWEDFGGARAASVNIGVGSKGWVRG